MNTTASNLRSSSPETEVYTGISAAGTQESRTLSQPGIPSAAAAKLNKVRHYILEKLPMFGIPATQCVRETALFRNGSYAGQRFECEGLRAVWLHQDNVLEFFPKQRECGQGAP
jgi:hypothetical protein